MQRRMPTQKRSEDTVGYLYEAVARIMEQGSDGRLTTNHIAEKAGVSIGTLYGYFPDKSALLRAMARQEVVRQQERVRAVSARPRCQRPPKLSFDTSFEQRCARSRLARKFACN